MSENDKMITKMANYYGSLIFTIEFGGEEITWIGYDKPEWWKIHSKLNTKSKDSKGNIFEINHETREVKQIAWAI